MSHYQSHCVVIRKPTRIIHHPLRFLTLVALLAVGTFAASADHTSMNHKCPVSDKAVDATVKMMTYNSKTDQAAKAIPGSDKAMVGFCSMKRCETYEKYPSKYQDALEKEQAATK